MKKKIYLLIALSLIAVLLISTVVLAFVKKDYSVDANLNAISVGVYYNGNSQDYSTSESEYGKIINKIEDSFKTTYLKALFQGKAGVKPVVNEWNSSSIPGMSMDGSYSNTNYAYICLVFNSAQNVKVDGVNYRDNEDELTREFTSMYIELTNANSMHDVKIYYRNDSGFLDCYTLTMANQYELYEYVKTLNI